MSIKDHGICIYIYMHSYIYICTIYAPYMHHICTIYAPYAFLNAQINSSCHHRPPGRGWRKCSMAGRWSHADGLRSSWQILGDSDVGRAQAGQVGQVGVPENWGKPWENHGENHETMGNHGKSYEKSYEKLQIPMVCHSLPTWSTCSPHFWKPNCRTARSPSEISEESLELEMVGRLFCDIFLVCYLMIYYVCVDMCGAKCGNLWSYNDPFFRRPSYLFMIFQWYWRIAAGLKKNQWWILKRDVSDAIAKYCEQFTIGLRSDETEKMTILTTMGFDHQAAEASLKRCSSIEVRRRGNLKMLVSNLGTWMIWMVCM